MDIRMLSHAFRLRILQLHIRGRHLPSERAPQLVYHWACQTNVQNVVQWVKVDNLYVKGLFTWLRAICTSAIHQHMNLLGGAGKKVEVGVISLGTTSHDGTQRQVKVEVLGVLDPAEKLIRLRAVEPLAEHEKNYKKRFQKILEPLVTWVHPSSVILTDLTVDKGTLVSMGFKNVHQSSSHTETPARNSNANIMEYLRRIVPRMFQNTLSLLSRQIIQQFLDELVWREKFGISPGQAFDNIVLHIAEQTKFEAKDAITVRLNKIAANPFKNWKYPSKKTKNVEEATTSAEPETGRGKRGRRKKEPTPEPPPKKKRKEKTLYVPDDDEEEIPLALRRTKIKQEREKTKEKEKEPEPTARSRRKVVRSYVDDDLDDVPLKSIKKEIRPEETVSMERYYFGQLGGEGPSEKVAIAVECPECQLELNNNCELMDHLFTHVAPAPEGAANPSAPCRYCLARFPDEEGLATHLKQEHPSDTKTPDLYTYACLICEVRFAAVLTLATHMQKTHAPLELPYNCDACDYRASSQRRLLDHFRHKHGRHHSLQCPVCLKNKARPPVKDSSSHTMTATYEDLTLVLPDGMLCRECDTALDSDKHFLGSSSCTKCSYESSCYRAMLRHSGYCAGAHSLEDAPRDAAAELHCVCSYRTTVVLYCYIQPVENVGAISDYAPPSVLNTQLSLDDLAPPSVLQTDQDAYDRPLATPRHEEPGYSLGDFEPLPQEPPPQPDFEQL
ncbi:hypothetical protein MSG28_002502 [Choristoneura fumiferana]|uniref:Uncharacterized protein n=1 Tax=Choristoneura fumiferana TaxID=7141 RepID=A0ACC0JWB4_CHOFU|nr:hypothetical protein MSG28_002502 [Choristoneura fumiferana]